MKSKYFKTLAFFAVLACTNSAKTFAQNTATKDTTIDIKVTGIICGMDLPLINERVKKEIGVKECKAISKPGAITQFSITYNPSQLSYQKIIEAVEDAPSCEDPKDRPYKVKKKH